MVKNLTIVLTIIVFILTGYVACIKDKCGNVFCDNSGVCVDGVCACARGYEGASCAIRWTDKFTGSWSATDAYDKSSNKHTYTLDAVKISALDSFVINGLADSITVNLFCKRDSMYRFSFIAEQKGNDTSFVIKSGYGKINAAGTIVTGMYSFKFGDTLITTNFTWTH